MSLEQDILTDMRQSMEKSIESLRHDLAKLRTGRANIGILDDIRVDYYGVMTPLSQCANLSASDPRLITIKPWERGIISNIERALQNSDIGITPQNDGEVIRLPIPALTEERRRDLVKQAKARGEDAKIAMRTHRRDANELLKDAEKDKEISQDELKKALERVQQDTDKSTAEIDTLLGNKEKEILDI
ncbi:MAG: ribosome recycling factor [Myxococcota bacterium]